MNEFDAVRALTGLAWYCRPCALTNDGGQRGWTALMFAAVWGRVDIVEYLVEAGADANATNAVRGQHNNENTHVALC